MVDHSLDAQVAAIPENILFAIASMQNPTVEGIRRKLPGPQKALAEELAARHSGSAVAEEQPADTAGNVGTEGAGEGTQDAGNGSAAPVASQVSSVASAHPAATVQAPSAAEAAGAGDEANPPAKKRLNPLAEQLAQQTEKGGWAKVDEADFVPISPDAFAEFEYDPNSFTHRGRVRVRAFTDSDDQGTTEAADSDDQDSTAGTNADGSDVVEIRWEDGDWPKVEGALTLYRVFATDGVVDSAPDSGEQIIATMGRAFVERIQPGTAMRHYQVWAYTGRDLNEITASQPYLVGEELLVLPIEGVELQCSEGIVEGNWNYVEQYDHVEVFASLESSKERADSPEFQLRSGVSKYRFEHETNSAGQTMRYALKPFVRFRDADVAGKVVIRTVEVEAVLQAPELEVSLDATDGKSTKVNVAWYSPPAGNVRIYFTPKAPSTDLTLESIPESALSMDLAISEGYKAYEDPWSGEGEGRFVSLAWKSGWTELHITPVTVLNGEAVVGKSKVLQQVGVIDNASIVERTAEQLVSFVWPQGADTVRVEVAPRGSDEGSYREPRAELDRGRYIRDGGVRLKLNPDGETVYLTPLSTFMGEETTSPSLKLDYPGLVKYYYSFELVDGLGFKLFIWKDGGEDLNPPRFVGVYHRFRLPLSTADASDIDAAQLQISTVNASNGHVVSEAGSVITPNQLLGSEREVKNAEQCYFVNFNDQQFNPANGGRLRLFIEEESVDSNMPRRVLLDTFNHLVAG